MSTGKKWLSIIRNNKSSIDTDVNHRGWDFLPVLNRFSLQKYTLNKKIEIEIVSQQRLLEETPPSEHTVGIKDGAIQPFHV